MSLEVLWGSQTEETWEGKICFPLFFCRQEIVNIDKRQYTSFSGCERFPFSRHCLVCF